MKKKKWSITLTLMTSKVILFLMKNLCLYNVSNHRFFFFYQNLFKNEYARKKPAKISDSEFFLMRCRRTYTWKQDCFKNNLIRINPYEGLVSNWI